MRKPTKLPSLNEQMICIPYWLHLIFLLLLELFCLGITAAAYSSADSTLTALTTSFCYDFLQIDKNPDKEKALTTRKAVHLGFTLLMFFVILLFRWINDQSVINAVFLIAGYTYGPLLGLYSFGLFTRYKVKDAWVPYLAVIAPLISFLFHPSQKNGFGGISLVLNC